MKQFNHIQFNEVNHTYRNVITDTLYTSVTTFINKYKTPFDPSGSILIASAKKQGKTPSELKAEWEAKNEKSKVRGSAIHHLIELLLRYKDWETYDIQYIYDDKPEFTDEVRRVFPYISLLRKKKCKSYIEQILYTDNKQLAGQADLILEYKNHIEIEDWKTNEKDDLTKSYGNMTEIFKDLPQCSFNEYAIQLVLYGMMAEKIFGKPCKKHTINHIYNGFNQYVIDKKLVNKIRKKLNFLFE